ncbi:MAG: GNAT family N-acetyltransferase [Eubacteriaceae bacterium]|nr:GNAT family N-acetyltransferase [Eubacteriaceae bacterium]
MDKYEILSIKDHPGLIPQAAEWFAGKWKVSIEAYLDSMNEAVDNQDSVPDWFIIIEEGRIIAGLGVIENDFHARKDLAPNVCAVFVEKEYRRQGIARMMLGYVVEKLRDKGISPVYLLTDHTEFYEKIGWEFYCQVQETSGGYARLYIHR